MIIRALRAVPGKEEKTDKCGHVQRPHYALLYYSFSLLTYRGALVFFSYNILLLSFDPVRFTKRGYPPRLRRLQ